MRLHSIRALNPRPEENLQLYNKLAKKRIQVSELVTSFSISSPGPLVFKIVLMTMRVIFVVKTTGNARYPGTLSYQLTDRLIPQEDKKT